LQIYNASCAQGINGFPVIRFVKRMTVSALALQAENELVSDGCMRPESGCPQHLGDMKGTRINGGIRGQTQRPVGVDVI
jgi:hypothetical protein